MGWSDEHDLFVAKAMVYLPVMQGSFQINNAKVPLNEIVMDFLLQHGLHATIGEVDKHVEEQMQAVKRDPQSMKMLYETALLATTAIFTSIREFNLHWQKLLANVNKPPYLTQIEKNFQLGFKTKLSKLDFSSAELEYLLEYHNNTNAVLVGSEPIYIKTVSIFSGTSVVVCETDLKTQQAYTNAKKYSHIVKTSILNQTLKEIGEVKLVFVYPSTFFKVINKLMECGIRRLVFDNLSSSNFEQFIAFLETTDILFTILLPKINIKTNKLLPPHKLYTNEPPNFNVFQSFVLKPRTQSSLIQLINQLSVRSGTGLVKCFTKKECEMERKLQGNLTCSLKVKRCDFLIFLKMTTSIEEYIDCLKTSNARYVFMLYNPGDRYWIADKLDLKRTQQLDDMVRFSEQEGCRLQNAMQYMCLNTNACMNCDNCLLSFIPQEGVRELYLYKHLLGDTPLPNTKGFGAMARHGFAELNFQIDLLKMSNKLLFNGVYVHAITPTN